MTDQKVLPKNVLDPENGVGMR